MLVFTEEEFRCFRNWATTFLQLRAEETKVVSAAAAYAAVGPKATRRAPGPLDAWWRGDPPVLIDVRDARLFARGHPEGADSVPLHTQLAEPESEYEWARVVAFGRLPDRSDDFIAQVDRLVSGKKVREQRGACHLLALLT